jgi:hypothetical protein
MLGRSWGAMQTGSGGATLRRSGGAMQTGRRSGSATIIDVGQEAQKGVLLMDNIGEQDRQDDGAGRRG